MKTLISKSNHRKLMVLTQGLVFLFTGVVLSAQESVSWARSMTRYSAGIYLDQDALDRGVGTTLGVISYHFFQSEEVDGFYYSLLTSASVHSNGKLASMDTRLVTLGWHGTLNVHVPLYWSTEFSPVLGSRSEGRMGLGSGYWGVAGALVGAIPVLPGWDIGLSWSPTWILARLDDSPPTHDQRYHDIQLVIISRSLVEVRAWPWEKRQNK